MAKEVIEIDVKTGAKIERDETPAEKAARLRPDTPKGDDQYVTLGEVKALIAEAKGK